MAKSQAKPAQTPLDPAYRAGGATWPNELRRRLVIPACVLAMFADGYDFASMPLVIPRLELETGLPASSFALVAGASMAGALLGGLTLTLLADRFGKMRVLAFSLILVAASVLASTYWHDLLTLSAWRLLTGVGLGGIPPVVIAIMSDAAPARQRALFTTLVVGTALVGGVIAGLAAPVFDSFIGWRGLYYVGAVLPAIAALLAAFALTPLVLPGQTPTNREKPPRNALAELFRGDLKAFTPIVWIFFVLNLSVSAALGNWLPTILVHAGSSLAAASRITALMSVGSLVGGLIMARISDRGDPLLVLMGSSTLAALSLAAFAVTPPSPLLLSVLILTLGLSFGGLQMVNSVLFAGYYPAPVRSTALGWGVGVGRIGAFGGIWVVSLLLGLMQDKILILSILGVPMLGCAICILRLFMLNGSHGAGGCPQSPRVRRSGAAES